MSEILKICHNLMNDKNETEEDDMLQVYSEETF